MLISRGETVQSATLMKQLTGSISFLEHFAEPNNRGEE